MKDEGEGEADAEVEYSTICVIFINNSRILSIFENGKSIRETKSLTKTGNPYQFFIF